jgi:predicted nuclease of restriction endonuclease-like (RecB) superfamily
MTLPAGQYPSSQVPSSQDENVSLPPEISRLYDQVRAILDTARNNAARSVNREMVRTYWAIGQAIVEQEQQGQERAGYGERLIASLATRFRADGLKGFGTRNLWWMREFYLKMPILHALRAELSWTHYRLLLKVEDPEARAFYEREAAQGRWSTREMERQIGSLSYERALLSRDKAAALAQSRRQTEKYQARDFVKDPYVLEFLQLPELPSASGIGAASEAELEAALLAHLQEFLLELGRGFSFVGRQQRLTLDGDHFYVDLVFDLSLIKWRVAP